MQNGCFPIGKAVPLQVLVGEAMVPIEPALHRQLPITDAPTSSVLVPVGHEMQASDVSCPLLGP